MTPILISSQALWRAVFRFLGAVTVVVALKFLLYSLVMIFVLRSPQADDLAITFLKRLLLPTITIALLIYVYLLGSYARGHFGLKDLFGKFRLNEFFKGTLSGMVMSTAIIISGMVLGYLSWNGSKVDSSQGVLIATGFAQVIVWLVYFRTMTVVTQDLSTALTYFVPIMMFFLNIVAFGSRGGIEVLNLFILCYLHYRHGLIYRRHHFHWGFLLGFIILPNAFFNIPLLGITGTGPIAVTPSFDVSMLSGGPRGFFGGAWCTLILLTYTIMTTLLFSRRSDLQ